MLARLGSDRVGAYPPLVRCVKMRLARTPDGSRSQRCGRHRYLRGWAGPVRARLRAEGRRGQSARPQPAATPRQVGPDRRPSDPGRGGHHHAQDPRGPGRDDPGAAGGRRWQQLQAELDRLDRQLQELVSAVAPTLVALPGVRIDTAGQLLVTAGDNPQTAALGRPPSPTCAAPLRSRRPRAAPTATD